jgi:IS4 transposase
MFLTNNFQLPAEIITQLYKDRWRIETFFRWIKHNLRIKSFYGISANAVKLQIWTAISTYLLVAILKKELRLEPSLYTILQILSVSLLEKRPIFEALSMKKVSTQTQQPFKQLALFD